MTESKLSVKQAKRLRDMPDSARVVGWNAIRRGPIIQFSNLALVTITRDGGISTPKHF